MYAGFPLTSSKILHRYSAIIPKLISMRPLKAEIKITNKVQPGTIMFPASLEYVQNIINPIDVKKDKIPKRDISLIGAEELEMKVSIASLIFFLNVHLDKVFLLFPLTIPKYFGLKPSFSISTMLEVFLGEIWVFTISIISLSIKNVSAPP